MKNIFTELSGLSGEQTVGVPRIIEPLYLLPWANQIVVPLIC